MSLKLTAIFSYAALFLAGAVASPAASYVVKRADATSTKFVVTATLPMKGDKLEMERSWPGDVPSVGEKGWPALVGDLRVADAKGGALTFSTNGPAGWRLDKPYDGIISLTYTVDYSVAAAANWPSPREAAFADTDHFSFSGRSLFITTPASAGAKVSFEPAQGWQVIAPWPQLTPKTFQPASNDDLRDNLIVFSRRAPDVISAGGFRVSITPMGKWMAVRPQIRKIIGGVIPVYVRMMGIEQGSYSVVLLPVDDTGGESYRNSFAFNVPDQPTDQNSAIWGHTIAHEIFHYWNGWRLKGKDYPSSQWFQEGFTDYASDMAMAVSGATSEREFLDRVEGNIAKYRKLTTPLDAPGNHKGPPLYGGGALVALCWDIQIRNATAGKRSLADVLRLIWQDSQHGKRDYEWSDIRAALARTADGDWQRFYDTYVHGQERLPLAETLALAGLKLEGGADGTETVVIDPSATHDAVTLRRSLVGHH